MSVRGAALWLFVALIGAAALAFGSVEYWTGAWLRFGLLVVAAGLVARGLPSRSLSRASLAVVTPVLAIAAIGLVQSLPVPSSVIRALSPRWAALRTDFVPSGPAALPAFLASKAAAGGASLQQGVSAPKVAAVIHPVSGGGALSVAPLSSRHAAWTWVSAALAFTCAAVFARRSADLYTLLWALAGWTGVLSAIGIVTRVSGTKSLMGLRAAPPNAAVLGPFVNPDHFAAFVEVGTLVGIGLGLAVLNASDGRLSRASIRRSLLDRGWALPRLLLLAGFVFLGVAALLLSRSRAGCLAFAAGFVVLLLARRFKRVLALVLVGIVACGLAVGVTSWAVGSGTAGISALGSSSDPSVALRWEMWNRTVQIFEDYPLVGTGLGTFKDIYACYDRPGEWMSTGQAHNDYLQLVAETGLVGAAVLVWALVVFLTRVLRPIVRSATPMRWTTAGCLGAVSAILVHTIFDFSLQTPAVAVEFAIAVGLLAAVAAAEVEGAPEEAA